MSFANVHPALATALAAQGYETPTPVQAAVMEADADGRDLLVSAQTGSGKTVAFGIAGAATILGEERQLGRAEAPLALVIAPTRELAQQVARELEWLYADARARVTVCVGGVDARREQRALYAGAHIVVGTPGRLRDHLERGNLDLASLRMVVLDEADEMLDMGFREDLEFILDAAPPEKRTLLFSATLAKDIVQLAKRYQNDALRIDTTQQNQPHGDIEYRGVLCAPNEIENAVVNVLRYFEAPGALVFCNTRDSVRHLHSSLRERGFSVVGLSGELSQKDRSDALQALRDGHARVCVATDVAARGIDLPDLGLVIHAELPVNKATLLHRSGRTGRAGKKGVSVLMTPFTRRRKAESLLWAANVENAQWSGPPAAEEIRAKDQARMLSDPILTEEPTQEDRDMARLILADRSAEDIAAALVRVYRSRLPEPEEVFAEVRDARAASPRPPREHDGEPRPGFLAPDQTVWFKISVGRSKNADPKWLMPMICRLGHVTKPDIGKIRIFTHETKFEISKAVADRFTQAAKATLNDDIRIEPSYPPSQDNDRPRGPRRGNDEGAPRGKFAPRPERAPREERGTDRGPRPAYDPLQERPARKPFKDGGFKPQKDFKPKGGGFKGPKRPKA